MSEKQTANIQIYTSQHEEDVEERAAAFIAGYEKLAARHEVALSPRPDFTPDGRTYARHVIISTRQHEQAKDSKLENPDD